MSTAKSADGAVIGRDSSRASLSHRLSRIGPLPILILIAIDNDIFACLCQRLKFMRNRAANTASISLYSFYLKPQALKNLLVRLIHLLISFRE